MQNPKEHRQNVYEILNFFSNGAITPRVNRVFGVEEFYKAFELFEENLEDMLNTNNNSNSSTLNR